jgi:hypothetical protein
MDEGRVNGVKEPGRTFSTSDDVFCIVPGHSLFPTRARGDRSRPVAGSVHTNDSGSDESANRLCPRRRLEKWSVGVGQAGVWLQWPIF